MSASTLQVPLLIYRPFGAAASNPTYINLPIPDASQTGITVNAASFADGFPPSTMTPEASGGLPFFGQDMNGILWMVSAYCANFAAGAFSKYNSTIAANVGYPLGAVIAATGAASNNAALWVNMVDGNTSNPNTGGTGWFPFGAVGGSSINVAGNSNVTLTPLQSMLPYLSFSGALTGNINVIFQTYEGQSWIVTNVTSGAFTLTCKTASGSGVVVPATGFGAPTSIFCDGTNIQNTGISTAGLAPTNSPALTGTPTAPTASPATTNTTQIATTAFVQAAITAGLTPYATKASPVFSGTPTAPTPSSTDNSLKLATTAFVNNLLASAKALTGTGYFQILGFMIQWGRVIGGSGAPQSVSFNTPFGNGTAGHCYAIVATAEGADATIHVSNPLASDSGFTLANGAAGVNTDWIAVGAA